MTPDIAHTGTTPHPWPIHGTVYGVLLNAQAEWQAAQALMTQAPYKAPPQAQG